jgi:CRISPR-associated endonuclease/helicase Cas3
MQKFDRLLAKSKEEDEPWSDSMLLHVHLADVHNAASRVLDATGDDQLKALGLPVDEYREQLRRVVLLAAATHDLGKANDHFQGMIHKTRDVRTNPQGLRHEWVTLLLLRRLRDWLLAAVGANEMTSPSWNGPSQGITLPTITPALRSKIPLAARGRRLRS